MSQDFQVIRMSDVVNVSYIEEAVGVVPRALILTGEDFTSVEKVIFNGLESPEFVHYAPNKILAQVPSVLSLSPITDVFVLSNQLTLTERSLVSFTVGGSPRSTTGIVKLMQNFLRMLLRTGGRNVFVPNSGGGMLRLVGSTLTTSGRDLVASDAAVAVSRTRQYIIGVQSGYGRSIPPDERLLNAEVVNLNMDPQNGAIYLSVSLTTHAGRRAIATLTG